VNSEFEQIRKEVEVSQLEEFSWRGKKKHKYTLSDQKYMDIPL
jgi:hypothetical protein